MDIPIFKNFFHFIFSLSPHFTEITEYDISNFIKEAKKIMEHPAEMLINIDNPTKRQALFGLVFEETPTYDDILNGTPKLTLIFKLSSDQEALKSYLARHSRERWNFF